jgi:hypothetical protein
MATVVQISDELVRLLDGEQDLHQFNEWLARNTWNIHRESPDVQELVGTISIALAEFSDGQVDSLALRRQLAGLVKNRTQRSDDSELLTRPPRTVRS